MPQWADEPLKADIRIRHLASHSSGIEEVPFLMGERGELHGWQKEYFDNDTARYTLALTRAPIQFPPGTEYSYSGTGYYVIATVLATAIRNTSTGDARTLLERRLMQPLEIPEDAWRISYGRKTTIGELDLYAIGSGAQYTARAVARVGQLMLNRGTWKGRQIVAPESVDAILGRDRPPPPNLEFDYPEPRAAYGWWTNQDGLWPSLPRSAFVGAGADHRILLVVPDLDLVMVRLGASLTGTNFGGTFWRELEEYLFEPLTGAIDATSVSSVRGAEQ
ncbi:MAG: serine hydrolase domain-containing protein [Longimicrobiales bacterium]